MTMTSQRFSLDRRTLLAGAGAALLGHMTARAATPPFWQPIVPADARFAADLTARLEKLIADKRASNLHGVLVVRGGRLVLERYFSGDDQVWGRPLGVVRFGPNVLHDLRSVSKSIVGLLYGIALANEKVPPPDVLLYRSFPEYADLFEADPRRRLLTVAHVLTMTLGTAWNENVPYSSPANSETAMEMSKDRYRYVLEQPVVGPPGKRFIYNGGATALLARLIAKGTSGPLHDYARAALFDPLGLAPTKWIRSQETWLGGGNGEPAAASGLRMTPRDLARIGQLVLDKGVAAGRPLVPAQWLADCFTPRVSVDEYRRYGYQWYMGDFEFGPQEAPRLEHWVGAYGNGGQRLYVMPELDLVVAITAGNYNASDQWVPPTRVMREVVLASV